MSSPNPWFLTAFVAYLGVVLLIGVWAFRRTGDVMDFWVYGQRMGPGLASASLIANFVSAVSVIGFVGSVYVEGYAITAHTILGLMLGLVALYAVVGYVRPMKVLTFPDLVYRVTGIPASRPLAGSILLLSGWLYLVMQLVGAGLLVSAIMGLPYSWVVGIIGVVFIAYTVLGGLVSVAWTDLLQGILMISAVFVTLVFMVHDLGGLTQVQRSLAEIDPSFVDPLAGGRYTWAGIAGSMLAFFGTILTEQDMLIRIAATRDVRTAKIHVAVGGAVLSVFYVGLVLLGGAASVALRGAGIELTNPDAAFPALITSYVPTGIGVVIILAVMSAILSTTDTRLHATGMTWARDLYSYARPEADEHALMRVSRWATVVLGLAATFVALRPPSPIIVLYAFRAVVLTSAFFVPVYLALFRPHLRGGAVLTAIAAGGAAGALAQIGSDWIGAIPATFVGVGTSVLTLGVVNHLLHRQEPPRS